MIPVTTDDSTLAPGRLVDTAGQVLPLERCALRVDAKAGLARVVLEQHFKNPHAEPLRVTYTLPLPHDGAVGAFSFRIGDLRIVGTVEGRSEARERFERAIAQGHTAALLEEERASLFTQEIGNVPPGESVVVEIVLDQLLAWIDDGSWEWRFPLAAAPRYLGAGPIEGDVRVDVSRDALAAHASLALCIRDALADGRSPSSPSHAIACTPGSGGIKVDLDRCGGAPLDRDVVVRWPVAALEPSSELDAARPAEDAVSDQAYALLTLVPPRREARARSVRRDLTLLIDTSGSMKGEPLSQAKRVCAALVDALGDGDTLEMIEFSSTPSSFRPAPEPVTVALKAEALAWIGSLAASGGTEMLSGVRAAMRELRAGSQRQIVLVTDGLVGFETQIVAAILGSMPPSARFHAVGIGSSVNRSLLAPVARAGRGVEAILGIGEDPERAAARLFARTAEPLVVDLAIEGSAVRRAAPARLPDLFAGAPARIALELDPNGGEIVVRGRTSEGPYVARFEAAPLAPGAGSAALPKRFARELVEDLEMRITGGQSAREVDAQIEATGKRFQIATRLTSWIAVSDAKTVDPRSPSRRVVQPQQLPYGMSVEGLGLRAPSTDDHKLRTLVARAVPPPMAAAPGRGIPPAAIRDGSPVIAWGARSKPETQPAPRRPMMEAPSRLFSPSASGVHEIVGRITFAGSGKITVEFTVPEPGFNLAYASLLVWLVDADGSELEARIEPDASTREGRLDPGVFVRLTLRATDEAIASFTMVRIVPAPGWLVVAHAMRRR